MPQLPTGLTCMPARNWRGSPVKTGIVVCIAGVEEGFLEFDYIGQQFPVINSHLSDFMHQQSVKIMPMPGFPVRIEFFIGSVTFHMDQGSFFPERPFSRYLICLPPAAQYLQNSPRSSFPNLYGDSPVPYAKYLLTFTNYTYTLLALDNGCVSYNLPSD